MQEETPIFVRGLSRSGGTLIVTMLDAHPEVAMSYELYPTLLELEDGSKDGLARIEEIIAKARNLKQAAKRVNNQKLKTFILRCPRGGIEKNELAQIFREHMEDNQTVQTVQERLQLIARCCRYKMRKEGKSRWGLKCDNRFSEYLRVWPKAYFLNMLRDGRDVLASQLKTGSFKNTPAELGKSWASTHRKFREIMSDPAIHAYEVRYETLVRHPDDELIKICSFLDLQYDPVMLNYHRKKLTIYNTSHLSMNRISSPVDASKVGRWKKDLTKSQIEEFRQASQNALIEFGYHDL